MTPPRFVLEKHTDDPFWCWRVRDHLMGASYGYGMLESDATWLLDLLEKSAHDPQ